MNERDAATLQAGLRALAHEMAAEQAPARVETALRAEFRRRRSARMWRRAAVVSGIAASIVMLAASAMIRLRREPAPVAERPPVVAPTPAPELALAPAPAQRVRGSRPPRAARPAYALPREVATDFFPVMGADLSDLRDRGSLVRVRLPRSALAVFGLPVHPDRLGGTVNADVLVGEDGLARAIRFVR